MIDALAGIISLMTSDAAIGAETQGRIFGSTIPAGENQHMPRKCIRVQFAGGVENRGYAQRAQPRFDFYCFGETRLEAAEVDRALWDLLHNVSRETASGVLIHSVMLSGGPLPWVEPNTDWYGLVRSGTVQVSTEEA